MDVKQDSTEITGFLDVSYPIEVDFHSRTEKEFRIAVSIDPNDSRKDEAEQQLAILKELIISGSPNY